MYSWNTVNTYSPSHIFFKVPLIKFMVELTIHLRGMNTHLWLSGVPNNFPLLRMKRQGD